MDIPKVKKQVGDYLVYYFFNVLILAILAIPTALCIIYLLLAMKLLVSPSLLPKHKKNATKILLFLHFNATNTNDYYG